MTDGMALIDDMLGKLGMVGFRLTTGSAACGACIRVEADVLPVLVMDDDLSRSHMTCPPPPRRLGEYSAFCS